MAWRSPVPIVILMMSVSVSWILNTTTGLSFLFLL